MFIKNEVTAMQKAILEKHSLLRERNECCNAINDGSNALEALLKHAGSSVEAMNIAKKLNEYVKRLKEIDDQAFFQDIKILYYLEVKNLPGVVSGIVRQRASETGDIIPKVEVQVVEEISKNGGYSQITPEEIWFVKMLKTSISFSGVKILNREAK